MNPLENQRAADEISGLYQDLEERLMSNIVRHCRDYGQPIDSDVWLMKKLAEIGNLNRENIRIIAESTGLSNSAIERLLIETAERAAKEVDPAMQSLVRDGLARGAPEYGKSKSMQNTVSGFRKQARDTLNLCNTTMLYKARDAFKRIVQNIASDAKEIEGKQSFIDVLNRHTSAAVLGLSLIHI